MRYVVFQGGGENAISRESSNHHCLECFKFNFKVIFAYAI